MTHRPRGEGTYEVGYGKPPAATRFKPGRSGNPKGRPKGSRNFEHDLKDELGEKVLVREGQRELRISKQRAMIKSLAAKALRGDVGAIKALVDLTERHVVPRQAPPEHEPLSGEEQDVLALFEDRVRRRLKPTGDP
jgi:uncharacterized protein DUF5681